MMQKTALLALALSTSVFATATYEQTPYGGDVQQGYDNGYNNDGGYSNGGYGGDNNTPTVVEPETEAPGYSGDGGYGGDNNTPVVDEPEVDASPSEVPEVDASPSEVPAADVPTYGGGEVEPAPEASSAAPEAPAPSEVPGADVPTYGGGEVEPVPEASSVAPEAPAPTEGGSYGGDGGYGGGEVEPVPEASSAVPDASSVAPAEPSASGAPDYGNPDTGNPGYGGSPTTNVSVPEPSGDVDVSSSALAPSASAPGEVEQPSASASASGEIEQPSASASASGEIEPPSASASASGEIEQPSASASASGEIEQPSATGGEELPVSSGTPVSSGEASAITSAPVSSVPTYEEMITTAITTSYVYECPTGLVTVPTVITEIPAASASASLDVLPGWNVVTRTCENGPSSGEVITQTLPPHVAPTGPVDGPLITEVPSATAPSSAEASVTEAPVSSAPAEEEMITTLITTSYVYECPTGLVTVPTVVTEVPVATGSASVSDVIPGWQVVTRTCENGPSSGEVITQTLPPHVAPTGPVEGPIITSVESSKPAAPTNEPVVDVPVATPGEEVVTTVIKTTYTNICPTGLEETTAEVTKTIPASATSVPITISMTEIVTECTVCGETPTEVTLTVPATTPAAVETTPAAGETTPAPAESTVAGPEITSPPVYTISNIPEDAETIAYTISTPNQPPVIVEGVASKPVAASSAESIPCVTVTEVKGLVPEVPQTTDVVSATYDIIGPTGVAQTTGPLTITHPAADTTVPTVEYTTTVTQCANCGPDGAPQTVTLTIPKITSTLTITPTYFQTIPVATGTGVPTGPSNSTAGYVKPEAPLYTGAATRLGASVMAVVGAMAAAFVL